MPRRIARELTTSRSEQPFEPRCLRGDRIVPEIGEHEVTATLVVQVRIRPLLRLGDQSLAEHRPQGSVQIGRCNRPAAIMAFTDPFDDRVAVFLAVVKDEQDLEHQRLER